MSLNFKNIKLFEKSEFEILDKDCVCFCGESLDDRGEFILNQLSKQSIECIKVSYNEEDFLFNISGIEYEVGDIEGNIKEYFQNFSNKTILIESTTLNVVEVLYICDILNSNNIIADIKIIYAEPFEYKLKKTSFSNYGDFDLSKKFKSFPPIPGYTKLFDSNDLNLVAFLGFERPRLGQIFSYEDDIKYNSFIPIIPLPAYKPGWENITLNNHMTFFNESYSFEDIRYISANNAFQAYEVLIKLSKTNKLLTIAPIGTKPNSIGCIVFLINTKNDLLVNTRLIYDFPEKVKKRSTGVGIIHLYSLNIIPE